jgi:large subunit ribosomal protein L1
LSWANCWQCNEIIQTLIKLKPTAAKGTYIKSIHLTSTMSPEHWTPV